MLSRVRGLGFGASVAALVILASSLAGADEGKSQVVITLSKTHRDAATTMAVTSALNLERGQENATTVFSMPDCTVHGSGGSDEAFAAAYPLVWHLHAKLVSSAVDQMTVALTWKRTEKREGVAVQTGGDSRTLTLRQGERHVLDFLPCPADSGSLNQLLEVATVPVEEEPAAGNRFSTDLWLVHRAADGRKTTQKLVIASGQNEKTAYRFRPVPLPLEPQALDSPLLMDVSGRLTVRLAADGNVQVSLETGRVLRNPTGSVSGTGTQTLTVRLDETTEVVVPPAGGHARWRNPPGTPLPKAPVAGVSVTDDLTSVDNRQFLAGSRTSISVTVHRAY